MIHRKGRVEWASPAVTCCLGSARKKIINFVLVILTGIMMKNYMSRILAAIAAPDNHCQQLTFGRRLAN